MADVSDDTAFSWAQPGVLGPIPSCILLTFYLQVSVVPGANRLSSGVQNFSSSHGCCEVQALIRKVAEHTGSHGAILGELRGLTQRCKDTVVLDPILWLGTEAADHSRYSSAAPPSQKPRPSNGGDKSVKFKANQVPNGMGCALACIVHTVCLLGQPPMVVASLSSSRLTRAPMSWGARLLASCTLFACWEHTGKAVALPRGLRHARITA